MLSEQNKIFTLLHVIVNTETTTMYKDLFLRLFTLVKDVTGQNMIFHHLHDNELYTVVMDMNTKQMTDLKLAVNEIDPQQQEWKWQLRNLIIFCYIHFFQGIDHTIETSSTSSDLHHCMQSLLTCTSYSDYMELCRLMIDE
ncbi:hypothetical protein I7I50_11999 [Histoplasma capsulatum G186AR]|uniref:Uncharacterized protein n=1 Tax=Ajellomyces capsulatus TaxID=5037 RepID=A0A8H7Y8R8_AJECA|nr:hypothetical protein I7I52_11703 [Histoplasma capsulatum]QSS70386.1 hypothetical protein I7I50_11999 [Histoplasma capsulatum G186AR]